MKICFATNNKNKLKELQVLAGDKFEILSLEDINCFENLPETSDTLQGNSEQKARFVFDKYGLECFADDTGLLVDALNGAPGVYSARYAGEEANPEKNMNKLLMALKNTTNRSAKFKTVITFIQSDGRASYFEGEVAGRISEEKSGSDGFGYDPIFIPDGYNQSFSEMAMSEKNKISHRARAVKKFIEYLNSI